MNDPRLQRARRSLHSPVSPSQQVRITEEEMLRDGVYEDRHPDRISTSIRRFQSSPVTPDARTEWSRRRADNYSDEPTRNTDYDYDRRSIPPRRSATQTNLPVVQGTRSGQARQNVRPRTIETDEQYGGQASSLNRPRRMRWHWLIFVGLSIFIMVFGWLMFTMLNSWWTTTQNDWQYGRPRTYQVDAVVGQNDSPANPSHFIAVNLNRQIVVIEIPGGDASKTRIFDGPILIGPGQDLTPVTLTFEDVNHDGKIDMVINVQDAHFVFLNEGGTFKPVPGQF